MDYFLQVFGEYRIEWAVAVILAVVFLIACYRKVEKYFSDKALSEREKDNRIQKVIDQAEQYPKWHQQSIDIRDSLSSAINEMRERLDAANKALSEIRKENNEARATACRYRILRFDDEIRHGDQHTKEHYDQVLEDITEYEKYCNEHPDYENDKAELAIANVKRCYQHCSDERSFL